MAIGKKGELMNKQSAKVMGPKGQVKSAPPSYNDAKCPLGMRQSYKQTGKAGGK